MVLETTIKISKKFKHELKQELLYGESYNDMLIEIFSRVKSQGWRYYEP
jgi:hypothetical protein